MVKIFDPNSKRKYYLVVIKNNKGQRIFLTNKKVGNAKEAIEVIKAYSYRWLIEETYKYLKQEYNLEKIHLRSEVERLNNYYMYACLEVVEYILHNGKFSRNRNQRYCK
ncbi:transposase [Candidatus Vampirococcus lugosii]|nr:transposase [Candidatus Vampirococcus lugosii]